MAAFLDILGSLIIRGGIILILLRLTLSMQEVLYERTEKAALERNLTAVSSVLSYEVRQLGYNVAGNPFVTVDSSRFSFRADVNNDGSADQIEYYLDPIYDAGWPGPDQYLLHRRVGMGTDWPMARGVTRFRFWYYDSLGAETADTARIRSIMMVIRLQSGNFFNGRYPSASWQAHIFPQNL
jgi:hypothetical protein